MKYGLRILSLLLLLCILTSSLTSCLAYGRIINVMMDATAGTDDPDLPDDEWASAYPYLVYTLTEDDEVRFYELLDLCETLTLAGTDIPAIEKAWEELEAQYYHIATQSNVAYILSDCDMEDETLSENYLFASEMSATVYGSYMELCQKIDQSTSPYREEFFSDWTEAQMNEMRLHTDEIGALTAENDEIMMDARDVDVELEVNTYYELYKRFIQNNNKIAQTLGYDNYYEYASQNIYLRDYSKSQRESFRQYVKQYLVPLCQEALDRFETSMGKLGQYNQNRVESFLFDDYDDLSKDYLSLYLNALPTSSQNAMESVLQKGNSLFLDSFNAYDGAYTAYLYEYESSICYFGPSYQDILTVVHEMGHYYAAQFTADEDIMLDLAEIHSQGNEMLLITFLEGEIEQKLYEPIMYYQLYSMLANVIIATVVDEFEETVYTHPQMLNTQHTTFDSLISSIANGYGGAGFVNEYITDIELYWKYVAIESPVYYISYATSGVVSISLFAEAQADFDAAQEKHRKLTEALDPSKGFAENVTAAGLASPFAQKTYADISALLS